MGLMQLLTVGRSLSEARDCPHRYKLRTEPWPTFGNTSRGWRSGRTEAGRASPARVELSMSTETAAQKNAETKQAYPKGRWSLDGNPFRDGRKVQAAAAAATAANAIAPAQGELSLEKVRPVRNDLSDSDLELIPAKQPEKNVFAAPTPAVPQTTAKPSLWARLAGMFRRGK